MTARPTLTERQLEILALSALRQSPAQVARRLGVTRQTVDETFRRVRATLGVATNDEAIARVREMGLIR